MGARREEHRTHNELVVAPFFRLLHARSPSRDVHPICSVKNIALLETQRLACSESDVNTVCVTSCQAKSLYG